MKKIQSVANERIALCLGRTDPESDQSGLQEVDLLSSTSSSLQELMLAGLVRCGRSSNPVTGQPLA